MVARRYEGIDPTTGKRIEKARVVVNQKELNKLVRVFQGKCRTLAEIHEVLRRWRKKNGIDITSCFYQFLVALTSL